MRRHMFESLLLTDENQRLSPGLAVSYEPLDDTTWEFKLREGVTFHDGSPFTARDVVFTVCRLPTVENSPSSFSVYRSEEHTSELQSLMRISYDVFCLNNKKIISDNTQ